MARVYKGTLADVTAQYPSFTPEDFRDWNADGFTHTETYTVPASPYTVEADYQMLRDFDSWSLTINGTAATVRNYGDVLAAGEVGVSWDAPLIQYAAADTGKTIAHTYKALATAAMARWHNQIQREIVAHQDALQDVQTDSTDSETFTVDADAYTGGAQEEFEGEFANPSTATIRFGNQLISYMDSDGISTESEYPATLRWNATSARFEFDQAMYAPNIYGAGAAFTSSVTAPTVSGTLGSFTGLGATTTSGLFTTNNANHTQISLAPTTTGMSAGMQLTAQGQTTMYMGQSAGAGAFFDNLAAGDFYLRAPATKSIWLGNNSSTANPFLQLSTSGHIMNSGTTASTALTINAPTTGTTRRSLHVAAPTGGSTNQAAYFAGDVMVERATTGHSTLFTVKGTGTGRAGYLANGASGGQFSIAVNGTESWLFHADSTTGAGIYCPTSPAGSVMSFAGGTNKGAAVTSRFAIGTTTVPTSGASLQVTGDVAVTPGSTAATGVTFNAPTTGTTRTTLSLAAPTGGTLNYSLNAAGAINCSSSITGSGFTANTTAGGLYLRQAYPNIIEMHIRPEAGKTGWLSFTENLVADRWLIGVEPSDTNLYFRTGNPTSNSTMMQITEYGDVSLAGYVQASGGYLSASANAGGTDTVSFAVGSNTVNLYFENGLFLYWEVL